MRAGLNTGELRRMSAHLPMPLTELPDDGMSDEDGVGEPEAKRLKPFSARAWEL